MPFAPNRDRALRKIEEARAKQKAAKSGSPQREMVNAIYEGGPQVFDNIEQLPQEALSILALGPDPVCAECGGEIWIFSPAGRPYCEAHQHLATELVDAALDAGCVVEPDSVLMAHDLAAEIQEWVMTVYRGGILARWREQLLTIGPKHPKYEDARVKLDAEYRRAQESHAKWKDYLAAARASDIQRGLTDPQCPLCAVDGMGDKVRAAQALEQYIAEHGGKARLCAVHSLKIRAEREEG